ncbi:YkgJ family cysteine cluster protein [Desulfomarina sp.]
MSFYREICRFIKKNKTFSLLGFVRFARLKLMGKTVLITGHCLNCGQCCQSISLEHTDGWLRDEIEFEAITEEHPEYKRFEITGKDGQGFLLFRCTWLTEEGLCRNHEKRLPLCRNFPEKSLFFCGGTLPAGCGYSLVEVIPFERELKKAMKKEKTDEKNSCP